MERLILIFTSLIWWSNAAMGATLPGPAAAFERQPSFGPMPQIPIAGQFLSVPATRALGTLVDTRYASDMPPGDRALVPILSAAGVQTMNGPVAAVFLIGPGDGAGAAELIRVSFWGGAPRDVAVASIPDGLPMMTLGALSPIDALPLDEVEALVDTLILPDPKPWAIQID